MKCQFYKTVNFQKETVHYRKKLGVIITILGRVLFVKFKDCANNNLPVTPIFCKK